MSSGPDAPTAHLNSSPRGPHIEAAFAFEREQRNAGVRLPAPRSLTRSPLLHPSHLSSPTHLPLPLSGLQINPSSSPPSHSSSHPPIPLSSFQIEAAFAFEREQLNVNDLRILIANDLFRMQHPTGAEA